MRVVVLGGGYAGLVVATKLENMLDDADDLMVIDKTGTHLLLHELHRIIRHPQYTELIEFQLDELLTESTTVVTGEVDNIDTTSQEIILKDNNTVQYDYCAICLGSLPDYYGLQHVEQYSVPVNTIQNIETIRDSIDDIIENQGNDIVIGGGGLSGIQVAGEIQALFNTKEINIPVHLLEQQANIAPKFPSKFQNAVADQLERIGVNLHTNCEITAANNTSVTVNDNSEIEYGEFIWTGGIQGPKAINEQSRPEIRADLRYKTNTFMAGDCAHVIDNEGKRVPASAQAAVQQGKVVAANINRCIQSDRSNELTKLERFRFNSPGWAVSIGDTAVAIIGSSIVTGKPAQVMKATAGIRYLATAGNISESLGLLREEIYL